MQSQTKQGGTYDQPTVLFVYRFLLSKLDAILTMHPKDDNRNATDLILHDYVPNVFRKLAHSIYVSVIFFVSICTGSF